MAPFVIDQDFPDPGILVASGTVYAYATNSAAVNVQVATSTDMKKWAVSSHDALPQLPSWAVRGKTWAPAVTQLTGGAFVMYFTATDVDSSRQCIGVATGASPTGPFTSDASQPLVCPVAEGGAIDPSVFTDTDGSTYLLYKNDGNCCGQDTWISIVRLAADGLSLAGEPTRLVKQTEAWEGSLVEAPVLVRRGGAYILFYSANDYSTDRYAIGTASSASVAGPYVKGAKPFLSTSSSGGRFLGPGGQDIVTFHGTDWLVFHSWDASYAYRGMHALPLRWNGSTPSLG
ncbi:MAG: arabinan endo,5-alpha-L-arabinosidase [Microbacteriaceae bacterium]|nr:arabinan endo,5-alpha-L-arabinosidase [Microbacteriaceae bacterium]